MQCFYLLFLNKSVLFFALLSTPQKKVKSFYPNIETILSEFYLESCEIQYSWFSYWFFPTNLHQKLDHYFLIAFIGAGIFYGGYLLFRLYKWACSPSALKWIWKHS
jgi:hypothetical protein